MTKQPLKKRAIIVFLGPPGAGKGTQAGMLSEKFGIPRISPGELGRKEIEKGTKLGRLIENYYDKGRLAPTELINKIIKKRLKGKDVRKGLIFDGYPRDMGQISGLEKMAEISGAVLINISDAEALRRLAGRRICGKCGSNYHVKFNPTGKKGICDKCGSGISRRDDDTPEAIRRRLKIYHQETKEVINYFRNKGILIEINGEQAIKKTHQGILSKILLKLNQ